MRTLPGQLLAALRGFLVLSVLVGLVYPLAIAGVGRLAFNDNAHGSLVRLDGKVVGSDLIGQLFTDDKGNPLPQYFQSRPSAAGDGYDPTATAASNRGPEDVTDTTDRTSLLTTICARSEAAAQLDGVDGTRPYCAGDKGRPASRGSAGDGAVPPDAVTASGSGLDPDISPAYARLQIARVAQARGLSEQQVSALVDANEKGRTLGFLGEPRVDVVTLNLALDRLGS